MRALLFCACLILGAGTASATSSLLDGIPRELSAWDLFESDLASLTPRQGTLPYDLNTSLFTDYAIKDRFIRLPEGTAMQFSERAAFDFPVGTIIAKTFSFPGSNGFNRIETRILFHRDDGWAGFPYIWNFEQTEATLAITGGRQTIEWQDDTGVAHVQIYDIPNMNQCKGCHAVSKEVMPIGLAARHLNRSFTNDPDGINQLLNWASLGALEGLPDISTVDQNARWGDALSGTVRDQARAYLDINCGHCHSLDGAGNASGLYLDAYTEDGLALGIGKRPAATGRATSSFFLDIAPGEADQSILIHRMKSSDPGTMMPELGRRLVHTEGVTLIEQWINEMPRRVDPPGQ